MMKELCIALLLINVINFLTYGIDNWKAQHGKWRISEATLLILAILGGSIGAFAGMRIWHHKTQHLKFKYGVPAIFFVEFVLFLLVAHAH